MRIVFFKRISVLLFLMLFADSALTNEAPELKGIVQRPLVFIPGILGSKLCDTSGAVVWGNATSLRNLPKLELGREFPESAALVPCGPIRSIQVLGPIFSIKQYSSLFTSLAKMGFVEKKNFFIFSYDWRKSNVDNASRFETFIARELPHGETFDILSHSMGGIITRVYLSSASNRTRVRRAIYMGTPFLGSSSTFETIRHGWGALDIMVPGHTEAIHRIVLSFPGFLELLPRYEDCCYVKHAEGTPLEYLNVFDPGVWLRLGWLPGEVRSGAAFERFSAGLSAAQRLTSLLARQSPDGITETLFAGDAHATPYGLGMPVGNTITDGWKLGYGAGDGTVLAKSAAANKTFDSLEGTLESFSPHATIFDDPYLVKQLGRALLKFPDTEGAQPIAKEGPPTVAISRGQQRLYATIVQMKLDASAPTLFVGDRLTGEFELSIKASDGLPIAEGVITPIGSYRIGGKSNPLRLEEHSDDEDLRNNLHRYALTAKPNELEGNAEIKVRVGDTAVSTRYVAFIQRK